MCSPSNSKSRIHQTSNVKPTIRPVPSPAIRCSTIWASAKTVQAKDHETLPVFPDFQKKPARTPTNLGKWGLAKRYWTARPIKANAEKNLASMIRPTKRAAKSGSPYICGKGRLDIKPAPFTY
jgi:hypothetical protein